MQTTISPAGPADFDLDVRASADEIQPRLDAALRKQRGRVQMRGFRPGKAPLDLVRKMYGEALSYEIAEGLVQEAFDAEVAGNASYRLIGRPALTTLDFDGAGDLHARIRFGVRPHLSVKGLKGERLTRLVHDVTDAEIDEELQGLRARAAVTEPGAEGEALTETGAAVLDLQPVGDDGSTEGLRAEEDVRVVMDDPRLQEPLRDALVGKTAGETFTVDLPHDEGHGDHEGAHTHRYTVTVKRVDRRVLPNLDDAFAARVSKERFETVDALRADVRQDLERVWEKRRREYLETQVVERLSSLNDVPVPDSAVELFLDSFVQQAAQQAGGKLPEGFDVNGYRQYMTPEARRQAVWMLIRDQLLADEGLTVDDADLDAYFEKEASTGGVDAALFRRVYEAQPRTMEMLEQRLLSEKLFDRLTEAATFEDKSFEDVQADLAARRAEV